MNKGFTLIELLVVVAIIGTLSSVVLGNLKQAKEKSTVTKTLADIHQIEISLRLLADDQGRTSWWTTDELGCPPLAACWPSIENMIEEHGLDKYLKTAPVPPIGDRYQYDSHGDTFVCGTGSPWYGVNIRIADINSIEFFNQVDQTVDKGDGPDCGRVKYGGGSGSFYYSLGEHTGVF